MDDVTAVWQALLNEHEREAAWARVVAFLQEHPIFLYGFLPYFVSLFSNVVVSTVYELLDRFSPDWFYQRFKIQYGHPRVRYPFMMVLKQVVKSQSLLFASSIGGVFLFSRFLVSFLLLLGMHIIDDLYFYWNHRMLHTQWMWKNVHAFHHQLAEPTALSTSYIHPFEMFLVSVGTFLAVLVCRPDLFTFIIFLLIRTGQDVANHSGWEFGLFSPWNWIPLHAPTEFHDTHHYRSNYAGKAKNLATTFVVWDMLFGTYSRAYHGRPASASAPVPAPAVGDIKRKGL